MTLVPKITLNNGIEVPAIGNGPASLGYTPNSTNKNTSNSIIAKIYGKFRRKLVDEREYTQAISHALQIGFTLLDYSASYGNENLIGKAIKESKVSRKDLFITTRVSNTAQFSGDIRNEFFNSLSQMELEYVDLYMFHWPVKGLYLDTWREMERLYDEGYIKSLGIANCHQHHIEDLLKIAKVLPSINQIEIHPLFTQKELITYCHSKNIQVQAYTAIARNDDRLVRLPLLKKISQKYSKTINQVVLRWHIQNEVIPIVRSLNKGRQKENIDIFDFELTSLEMRSIDSININSRLRYDPDNCDFSIL